MAIVFALVLVAVVGLILWQRHRSQRNLGRRQSTISPLRNASPPLGVKSATRHQLLRLVQGNQAVANRLLSQARQRYPGHSEQWYWEKAIYDIQRDRRS